MMNLGVVQADGSILLHDENILYREAMTSVYQRNRPSARQKVQLARWGFTSVNSSFISGIGIFDNDLRIRFLNGSVYVYYGFAREFDNIMLALSKGQYFNRRIRPTKSYEKIGSLPFSSALGGDKTGITDEELFQAMDFDYIKKLTKDLVGATIALNVVTQEGAQFNQFIINHNSDVIKILVPMIVKQ